MCQLVTCAEGYLNKMPHLSSKDVALGFIYNHVQCIKLLGKEDS